MNRLFLLCLSLLVCFMPVRVQAQIDAGTRLARIAQCMSDCMDLHVMCVSVTDIQSCIQDIESCQALATSEASIIESFCSACGQSASGCGAPPVTSTAPIASTLADAPLESVSSSEPLTADEPVVAPVAPVAPIEPVETGRSRRGSEPSEERTPTPPPTRSVEDLCRVAGGIWDPDYAVLQSRPPTAASEADDTDSPYPGEEVRGVCWTREGEVLARRLRAERDSRMSEDLRIEGLVQDEATARESADTRDEARSIERDRLITEVNQHQSEALDSLMIRMLCVENGGENIPLLGLPEHGRESMMHAARNVGRLEGGHIRCSRVRYRASTAGTFGFRFSLMPGVGFQPLTAEQTIESPVPFYLMGELSLTASIGGDWFIDGGLSFGYPFPDYRGRPMLEGIYHLGFLAVIENVVAVGFGGTLMERYTDVFQSTHTIAGGYVEFDYNLRRGGWQPYIGARIVLGAGMRAGYEPVLDGAAFIMLGIAHLDADSGH